jgi:hypothetical protein
MSEILHRSRTRSYAPAFLPEDAASPTATQPRLPLVDVLAGRAASRAAAAASAAQCWRRRATATTPA